MALELERIRLLLFHFLLLGLLGVISVSRLLQVHRLRLLVQSLSLRGGGQVAQDLHRGDLGAYLIAGRGER